MPNSQFGHEFPQFITIVQPVYTLIHGAHHSQCVRSKDCVVLEFRCVDGSKGHKGIVDFGMCFKQTGKTDGIEDETFKQDETIGKHRSWAQTANVDVV